MIPWIFYFYLYSFLGWCFESAYVSIKSARPVNRGFLRGPFLPIYGSGAVMMLLVSAPFQEHLILTYIAGCLGATALEYVTGVLMERLFKVRYWDYSGRRFNFRGQICLSSTAAWGFLTILMTELIHRPVERLASAVPEHALSVLVMLITIYIAADFALSFKAAMDLRDVLVRLDRVRAEMEHMQKRLDVLIALAGEALEEKLQERRQSGGLRAEELVTGIENRLESLKEKLKKKPEAYLDSVREEIGELWVRFGIQREAGRQLKNVRDFYKRRLILDNPGMVSGRFREALEELKEAAKAHKKGRTPR